MTPIAKVLMASALLAGATFAGTSPQQITFQEGEQVTVSLSRLNYNRVFVEGERIIRASYPEGTLIIDKSDLDNPASLEESIYLKPRFDEPLTLFLTTDKKHHVSLTIHADDSTGKTVRLVARQDTAKFITHQTRNVSEVETLMAHLQAGEMPDGFKPARLISRPFYVKRAIQVSLVKQYEGANLTAVVYRLDNTASSPIEISTHLFDRRHAESLALSEDTLAPKQSAYLYGLYRHEG